MYFLIILYYIFVLLPSSIFENIYYITKYSQKSFKNAREQIKHIKYRLRDNLSMAKDEVINFHYVNDRPLFKGLTINYIPLSTVIILNNGGDCSVLARLYKRLCKWQGLKAQLYIMYDAAASGFIEKLKTMHVFCICKNERYYTSYNASSIMKDSKKEVLIDEIKEARYIINSEPYYFKNAKIHKWR